MSLPGSRIGPASRASNGSGNSWRPRGVCDPEPEPKRVRRGMYAINGPVTSTRLGFPEAKMPELRSAESAGRGLRGHFAVMSTKPLFLRTLLDEDLPEFETEVRVRQIVDLARQTPFHAVANVGNGILLASVFWDRLSHLVIAAWLAIFVVFSGLGLYRWWRKRRW